MARTGCPAGSATPFEEVGPRLASAAGAGASRSEALVRDLNRIYQAEPALWEADTDPSGFQWCDANNGDENVIAFLRFAPASKRGLLCVCNFSPVVRYGYRVGVPQLGYYREVLNSDSTVYGGSNVGNSGGLHSEATPWGGFGHSLCLTLPPLATSW